MIFLHFLVSLNIEFLVLVREDLRSSTPRVMVEFD